MASGGPGPAAGEGGARGGSGLGERPRDTPPRRSGSRRQGSPLAFPERALPAAASAKPVNADGGRISSSTGFLSEAGKSVGFNGGGGCGAKVRPLLAQEENKLTLARGFVSGPERAVASSKIEWILH